MKAYAGSFFVDEDLIDTEYYSVDPSGLKPPTGGEWHEVYRVDIESKPGMELYDAGDSGLYHRGKTVAGWYDGPLFDGPAPSHPKIERI